MSGTNVGGAGNNGGVSASQQQALDKLDQVLTQALNASTKSSEIQADKNTARKIVDGAAVR
jgi:hypothetical protein